MIGDQTASKLKIRVARSPNLLNNHLSLLLEHLTISLVDGSIKKMKNKNKSLIVFIIFGLIIVIVYNLI